MKKIIINKELCGRLVPILFESWTLEVTWLVYSLKWRGIVNNHSMNVQMDMRWSITNQAMFGAFFQLHNRWGHALPYKVTKKNSWWLELSVWSWKLNNGGYLPSCKMALKEKDYTYWYQSIKGKQISEISAEEKLCKSALNIVLEFKQDQE